MVNQELRIVSILHRMSQNRFDGRRLLPERAGEFDLSALAPAWQGELM